MEEKIRSSIVEKSEEAGSSSNQFQNSRRSTLKRSNLDNNPAAEVSLIFYFEFEKAKWKESRQSTQCAVGNSRHFNNYFRQL